MRRILGLILVVAGLSTTWAWGEVARLAGPASVPEPSQALALYAAWKPADRELEILYRSTDEGRTWQSMDLPAVSAPVVWADDGGSHVAVVMEDGTLVWSEDQGDSWITVDSGMPILSLTWGGRGTLYLGTDGSGVYRLDSGGSLEAVSIMQEDLASVSIVSLSLVGQRLYAATPTSLVYTDDTGRMLGEPTWSRPVFLPDRATTIVATEPHTVFIGTETTGVYKSTDSGQTWVPAWEGLGLAAGQMVRVTALRPDPGLSGSREAGLLYAAVDHLVGGTHVQASAAGTFVTLDGGSSWQPLAGPVFPEARHASNLILVPGRYLYAQAVTTEGLQGYAPDVMRLLATLESDDPRMRVAAAHQLGLARPMGVWNELLAALDDPDPSVSMAAADALGRLDDPAAVHGLLLAIEHPSEQVRLGAARALGMLKVDAAVEPLRAMLLQGEGLEVSVAADALGRNGGAAAMDALLVALSDAEPTARWHASLAALERMGEPTVEPLTALLDNKEAIVRRNAVQALAWVGSPSGIDALVHTLRQDRDVEVRSQAAWALGEIGDPLGRAALERAAVRDSDGMVRAEAARALTRVPEQLVGQGGWMAAWASVLSRLQAVRWLVLALSLVGAVWLTVGGSQLVTAPIRLRHRFH